MLCLVTPTLLWSHGLSSGVWNTRNIIIETNIKVRPAQTAWVTVQGKYLNKTLTFTRFKILIKLFAHFLNAVWTSINSGEQWDPAPSKSPNCCKNWPEKDQSNRIGTCRPGNNGYGWWQHTCWCCFLPEMTLWHSPCRLLLTAEHCQHHALMLIITAADQDIVKDVNTTSPDIATISNIQ